MATMRMYCPSLKKNVEATITDGKQVASKGGSLRNILYGEYEGRKCLPKTVKAEVFAQHGFAAESKFDKLSHEIAEEYEEKGKTPEEAKEIGDATAAKIGRMKYGKKGMERKSLKGKEAEQDGEELAVSSLDLDDGSMLVNIGTTDTVNDDPSFSEMMITEDGKIDYFTLPTGTNDFQRMYKPKPSHYGKMKTQNETNEATGGDFIRVDGDGKYAETFEAYDDPISDRQEWKINSLGGTVDSSMNRSEASDYIKELQGRKSGTWKDAESSPSSFDISWEDAQGVSSPSLPPEGIHFAEGEFKADSFVCDDCEEESGAIDLYTYIPVNEDGACPHCGSFALVEKDAEYSLNGENCDYCAETRELNAEGFCSECAHHADYFNARSYEDAFRSESVSYASEGLTRNGKFALGLTALGVGLAMAMGSEKVASLLDKLNRK